MPSTTPPLHLCTCAECIKHVVSAIGGIGESQRGIYQTAQVLKAHRRRDALRRAAEVTEEQALSNNILRAVLQDHTTPTCDPFQELVQREHEEREHEETTGQNAGSIVRPLLITKQRTFSSRLHS